MNKRSYLRFSITLLLIFTMLSPAAVLAAGDGKKYFKQGMKHEAAEEWDKAAESFALAVTESPKNPEYLLHLRRALFNASQMFMKKGNALADVKDYQGAYVAYRKAFSFDPVNELARSEMARMVRLQKAEQEGVDPDAIGEDGTVKLVKTSYSSKDERDIQVPQKMEVYRDVIHPAGTDLQALIRDLAASLELNVLFDSETKLDGRKVKIELKSVTAAKALDYIFLQENLFFQKVGPRTILIASGLRRINLQQLVLRTFYLANADPKEIAKTIQTAIPAQPGRSQTIVLVDEPTNSITVRDTVENVQLIGKLISSLDKDRAEVVMDVAIYEVNKTDLLKFGNQLGTETQLGNLGGFGLPILTQGSTQPITGNMPFGGIDIASIALGIPLSQFSAFQKKRNTKLLASTQIHAFNNEDSSARIGQRVPVRTASFAPVGNTGGTNNNNFVGDVINYEQVGLTLKFKPIVFPNQDVQVAMEIESKDVAGGSSDNPIFIERTIKGTARIQNNKTLLLASVAQNVETNGRQGLPLLGLIPFIGRLFTAPTKDNQQVDIVIAITPRVIRAPAILPEDEVERSTGSIATPTGGSLEAMIKKEEREEYIASLRKIPTNPVVQLPDRAADAPTYVRNGTVSPDANASVQTNTEMTEGPTKTAAQALNLKPIDTSVRTLDIGKTSDTSMNGFVPQAEPAVAILPVAEVTADPTTTISFAGAMPEMVKGEKAKIALNVMGSAPFRSAVIGLKFDERKVAVRSISFGDVFGTSLANTIAQPFLNQNGMMYVSLSTPAGQAQPAGVLAYIEVEALADGTPNIRFEKDVLNFLTTDGRNFRIDY